MKASHKRVTQLHDLEGKTVEWALVEEVGEDTHQTLVIRFNDGVVFKAQSQDADDYESWLNYTITKPWG